MLRLWPTRGESLRSFKVPLTEIREHGEDLALGEYKKDHLTILANGLPPGWKMRQLGSIVEEVNVRAGSNHSYPVLSVTKHKGFVESANYFRKRIFSEDTSD